MDAPAALVAKSGEGKQQTLVAAGAPLPAAGRVVVATERACAGCGWRASSRWRPTPRTSARSR